MRKNFSAITEFPSVCPFAPDNTGNNKNRDKHDKNDCGDARHNVNLDKNTLPDLTLSLTSLRDKHHRMFCRFHRIAWHDRRLKKLQNVMAVTEARS